MSTADVEVSKHAQDMLQERDIPEEWMWRVVCEPDRVSVETDGNVHYAKAIAEQGARPKRIVTLFFDGRLGRKR
jgi:hypothetical protein